MTMLEPLQQTFWQETELPLMSSRAVSRAKTLALRESRQESQREQEAAYGQNVSGLLASYDRNTHSLRTSQTCLVALLSNQADGFQLFCQTWPARGMMRNGQIYQLPTLEPGTGGAEYGYLPTVIKSTASGAASDRWFGSKKYRSNLHEYLRSGPADPKHVRPDFCEMLMGFPIGYTELLPAEIQSSPKSPNS